jgi:hypothetical protein
MVIFPKKAKRLVVPLTKEAKEATQPGKYDGLFKWKNPKTGNEFLARVVAEGRGKKKKKKLELMYILLDKATIPKRPFIRDGIAKSRLRLKADVEQAVLGVMRGELEPKDVMMSVGARAVGHIQAYMPNVLPKKGKIALAPDPRLTTTLIQTGQLRAHVTFTVEEAQ